MVQCRKSAVICAAEKLSPGEMQERFQPLDPILGNLKTVDTESNRQKNWTVIARELKKFGILVDPPTKEKLIQGNQELINSLLPMLVNYEMRRGKLTEVIILELKR